MRILTALVFVLLATLAFGRDDAPPSKPADDQLEKERATLALELCRKAAKEYKLCLDDRQRSPLDLKVEPVLRWTNPSVGSIHGGVFLWTHAGRPAAVASIFKWFDPRDQMSFEVHSLSSQGLVGILEGKETWHCSRAGVEFKPLPGSQAAPGNSAAARLSQMRAISNDFTADKTDRDDQSHQQMRLLTQPIFRYTSQSGHVLDGAMFAFVQGTDPEVFLQLEARESDSGSSWHYALSRMNSTAFAVHYKDQQVWMVEVLPWGVVLNNKEPYNLLNIDYLNPPKK